MACRVRRRVMRMSDVREWGNQAEKYCRRNQRALYAPQYAARLKSWTGGGRVACGGDSNSGEAEPILLARRPV